MSDTHPRYIVVLDVGNESSRPYLVIDTGGGDRGPEVVCDATNFWGDQITNALNDWGKCDRLHDELHRMGVAREEQRQRTAREMAELRESRDDWKKVAQSCEAGTVKVTGSTLDDWVAALRRGNDVIFGHAEAAGLADEIERLREIDVPPRDPAVTPKGTDQEEGR